MHRHVGRSLALAAAALVTAVAALGPVLPPAAAAPAPSTYAGTLIQQRADSHIIRHTDGYYYFTGTVPEYDRIVLRRARTLQELATAPEMVIWRKHASGAMASHIWAPEIHFIKGKWYIYFAAGHAHPNVWDIRMYVLEGTGANPLTADWTEKGQIKTGIGAGTFALDATTFVSGGVRYLTWAEKPAAGSPINTNIYLAKMGANPWEIAGEPVMISSPTLPWETVGYKVNEGPAVIERNGRIFMTYSASATDANYCLGLLTAKSGSTLLDPASWTKTPNPILASNPATGQYGPGHNSFTTSEDGKTDILVYHDRNYRNITGNALDDVNRRTRVQPFGWNADGTLKLSPPIADPDPVRIRSHTGPQQYLRHWDFRARLEANVAPRADSEFRLVPGLAEGSTVSLESANFPGHYLRNDNGAVWVRKATSTEDYRNAASFRLRPGLVGKGVSFEAVSHPAGRYLRRGPDNLLYVDPIATATGRADATFHFEPKPAALPGQHVEPGPDPTTDPTAKPDPTTGTTAKPRPTTGGPTTPAAPSASPTSTRTAAPPGDGSGSGNGGGLASTGAPILMIGALGAAGVAVGGLMYVLARRRKLRWGNDQQ